MRSLLEIIAGTALLTAIIGLIGFWVLILGGK